MTFEALSARALEALAAGNPNELAAIASELEATGYTQAAHALKAAAGKLGAKSEDVRHSTREETDRRTAKDYCRICGVHLNGVGGCTECEARAAKRDTEPPAEPDSGGLTDKEKETINKALDWLEGFGSKVKEGEDNVRDMLSSDQLHETGSEIGRAAKLAARLLLDPKGTMADLKKQRERESSSPRELPPKPPFKMHVPK